MAWKVLTLFLRVDANSLRILVRLSRSAEAVWRTRRAQANRPVAGSGGNRVLRGDSDSLGTLYKLCRVHRKRGDGRSLLPETRAAGVLAGHKPWRVTGFLLLCLLVHRVEGFWEPEHRRD